MSLDPTALPDDGISDRTAIQAAIDAAGAAPDGGTVLLGAGTWTVERLVAGPGAYNTHAALATHGHHVTIRGVGPETVLELVGDQGNASVSLISIDPGAEHVRIADMTLRCRADRGCTNTEEQTHAIATSGFCAGALCLPIRDVSISNVTFDWPRDDAAHRKGDCIRLIGNSGPVAATETTPAQPGTRVYGVRIVDSEIGSDSSPCARSAITIQRGVYDATIAGNTLSATKTCIDGEATGGPLDVDERISITGNAFRPGCTPSLSLTSTKGAAIAGNTFASRVTIYRSTNVAFTGNRIDHVAATGEGSLDVSNACDGMVVTGNAITRSGLAGAAVKIFQHTLVPCTHFVVANNTITLNNASFGIYMEAASYASITGNQIVYTVAAPGLSAIYDRSTLTAAPVVSLLISNNLVTGAIANAVLLHASPATFGAGINVHGNGAVGATYGLSLSNPPGFMAPLTSTGNSPAPSAYGAATVVHGD